MLSRAAVTVRRILPLPRPDGSRLPRRLVLLLAVLCLAALWIRLAHIAGTLPYPRHIDEVRITARAHGMVTTGEYHPIDFIYPAPAPLPRGGGDGGRRGVDVRRRATGPEPIRWASGPTRTTSAPP